MARSMRRLLFGSAVMLAALSSQASWLNGWEFRRAITIDSGQIGADLVNFPVMVRLTAALIDMGVARPDGFDIRFTASDGITLLDYERERHHAQGDASIYWVRLPLVSSSSDTTFYLYYGNPRAPDGANPAGVWDAGHVAVWHLADSNGEMQSDSTANGHALTRYGEVAEGVAGIAGAGVSLDTGSETPQYLATPPDAFPIIDTTTGLTFSAWARPTKHGMILACGGGNWHPWWRTSLHSSGNYIYGYSGGGSGEGMSNHGASGVYTHGFYLDTWSHVAMTLEYDTGTNASTLRVYLNGNEVNKHSTTNRTFRNPFTGRPLIIGGLTQSPWPAAAPASLFGGILDEVRVSNARRSAEWIGASFNNQKAGSSLLRAGSVESVAAWYTNWKHRRRVVIDSGQIDGDLSDFPVLVKLTRDCLDFEVAREDGFDVRFTAADGATPLDYERECHDARGGAAIYWVRLPLVSSSSDTTFYLYFGNPRATDGANPAGVWAGDHAAVWHLGTSNGVSQADSTARGNHVSLYGPVDEGAPGIVGRAIGLSTNYLATPPGSFPTLDTSKGLTFSAWACPTNDAGTDNTRVILAMGGGNWSPYWCYYFGYYRASQMRGYASGSGDYTGFGSYGKLGTGFPRDVWSHVAMTLAHDTETDLSTLRFYVNGSLILSNSVTGNSLRPSLANKPLIIGGNTHNLWPNTTPTRLYGGWIDEARISTVQRSAAWLAASYRSQMPGSTLLDFGGLEPPLGTLLYLR